jgi:hypothetical protein
MDSATAALIGAGAGSAVAIGSQFINDALSSRRDRRNQKRDRLYRVISEAAEALYKQPGEKAPTRAEVITEATDPESLTSTEADLARHMQPFSDRTFGAMSRLQVHFGHDHWLIKQYIEVVTDCLWAEGQWVEHGCLRDQGKRIEEIPELADALRDAQVARDRWMREARAEVEKL